MASAGIAASGIPRQFHSARVQAAKLKFGVRSSLGSGISDAAKRTMDLALIFVLAVPATTVAVLFVLAELSRRRNCRALIQRTMRAGKDNKPFEQFSFKTEHTSLTGAIGSKLPMLWNILRGEMSFVGPRPLELSSADLYLAPVRRRSTVKPGLVCLWWLRSRTGIGFESEYYADREYVEGRNLASDFGIMLRCVFAAFIQGRGELSAAPAEARLFHLELANVTMQEAVRRVVALTWENEASQVSFVNAHCVNVAYRDSEYRMALRRSRLIFADGIGMRLGAAIRGVRIRENVNGTDMFPRLCASLAATGKSIYLLGAAPGVAASVANWARQTYPSLRVSGYRDGFFAPQEDGAVADEIARSGADVLLIALGVPRQDVWIQKNLGKTGVRVAMGVGGLFDFYSGRIPRAPHWVREIGMEWLFRFVQEPARLFERYFIGNFVFLFRVITER